MIFAILGEESFLVRRALERLLAKRLPENRDFNYEVLDGAGLEARTVMEKARTLPVGATRRVVLVRDADEIGKGEAERLTPLLSEIPETTDLILTGGKVDRRFSFWQRVAELGEVREFGPLDPREIPRWITEEAGVNGFTIHPEAAGWLVEAIGNNLSLLHSALEKLYLLKGTDRQISLTDAESAVTPFFWRTVFELTDAVGERNPPRALRLFRRMFTAGESPIALNALLARHFRILTRVKEGETSGVPFLREYQRQAGRFKPPELERCREKIFKADWALKSSPIPVGVVFERLLMELCHPGD